MAKPQFVPDSKGIRALAMSPQMSAAITTLAEGMVERIAVKVPKRSGRYAASLKARPATIRLAHLRRSGVSERAGAVIETGTEYAATLEWGRGRAVRVQRSTKRRPLRLVRSGAQHPMRKAVTMFKREGVL